ncbi:MAG: hypothetical protein ACO2YR_07285 [Nitrosopumilaceae archaeon]
MIWPGMGDPYKRKKTLKFLIITAIIGISVAAASTLLQQTLNADNPLKVCINDRTTPYKIKASLELIVDGQKAEIPANIGIQDGDCKRTLYTITNDGTIYAEWVEEYPFEIGHFLWMWDFPLRDMDQAKSKMYVNDKESEHFINHPLQDGYHYRAEFTSKAYDEAKDKDFLPEQ